MSESVPNISTAAHVPNAPETPESVRYEDAIPQLADVNVPTELKSWIEQRLAMYPEQKSAALPCLMAAQKLHGWLSPDAVRQVAAVMRVTPAYLVSVASFYDMFELEPRGRHTIYMCTNISCMLRGADAVMAELEQQVGVTNGGTSEDGIYLRNFECLGACDIAPMASVDGAYIGPLTVDDAKQLIEDLRAGRDPLPAKHLSKRPVATTFWAAQGDAPNAPAPNGGEA